MKMKIAIDVHYRETEAKVVGVLFKDWQDPTPFEIKTLFTKEFGEYVPGSFYKRELPCILALLETIGQPELDIIIIDGYVYLDDAGKHGLGGYLFEALNQKSPVIGVAKTSFHQNKKHVVEVFRGTSQKPLYISSIGIEVEQAGKRIQTMYGAYRIPDLLRIMDQETKV